MLKPVFFALAAGVLALGAGRSHAQIGPPAAPAPPPTCTASGYAPPTYGVFGTNDGFQTAYEIASPCVPRKVRDAAQAIGMGRLAPLGIKNVSTAMFAATGTYEGRATKMRMHVSYVAPGVRLAVEGRAVEVYADGAAWNETQPGVGARRAPAQSVPAREALIKLTPYGALWSVIEAEGNAQVMVKDGKTVISGASPYDKIPVTLTLDAKDMVESVEFTHGGHRYAAKFYDYLDSWDTGLDNAYWVYFPSRLVWSLDGRPLADLKVTDAKSNPYVVFPRPAFVSSSTQ